MILFNFFPLKIISCSTILFLAFICDTIKYASLYHMDHSHDYIDRSVAQKISVSLELKILIFPFYSTILIYLRNVLGL